MPTAFKQIADNAISTTRTDLSSAGVTSLILATGTGALFPQPGNGFYATLWNNAHYPNNPYADPNMEKVLVSARTSDSLTISATTKTHNNNCTVALLDVAQNTTDLQTAVNAAETNIASNASNIASNAAAITAETSRATAAEGVNAAAISTETSNRQTAVTNEANTRAAADTTLQANITSEATARSSADTTLQTNITTETTRATGIEATKANDSAVVHNTGNETIAGVKTFSSSPVVPNATVANQAAAFGQIPTSAGSIGGLLAANNLSDVSSATVAFGNIKQNATTGATGVIQLAGDLGGTATSPTTPTAVHLAGTETITGTKTFNAGSLLDKGNLVFNVKAYGAKGDGVTDDSVAVQSAVTAMGSTPGILYYPQSSTSYLQNTPVALITGIVVQGAGKLASTIKTTANPSNNGGIFTISNNSYIHITGLGFNVGGSSTAVTSYGHTGLRIDGCYFAGTTNGFGGVIHFNGQFGTADIRNTVIEDNDFDSVNNTIIHLYPRSSYAMADTKILHNHFKGTGLPVYINNYTTISDTLVDNNTFKDIIYDANSSPAVAVYAGISTPYTNSRLTISNNHYHNSLTTNAQQGFAYVYNSLATVISNNTIIGAWTQSAAVVGPCIAPGRLGTPDVGMVITGNYIEGFDAAWDPDAMRNVEVANNTVVRCGQGFSLGYSIQENINIHDNIFYNSVTTSYGGVGFQLDNANAKKCIVANNLIIDDRGITAPVGVAATLSTTAGTLAIGTPYYYKVTALDYVGETLGSSEVTATPTSGHQSINISFTHITGALKYNIYRTTTSGTYGVTSLVASVYEVLQQPNSTTITYVDTGTATTTGTVPGSSTTAAAVMTKAIELTGNYNFSDVTIRGNRFYLPNSTFSTANLFTKELGSEVSPVNVFSNEIADSTGIRLADNPLGSLVTPVSSGGTGTSSTFTQGSLIYAGASGIYAQDNSNLFYDATNKRLGIGTTTPGYTIEAVNTSAGNLTFAMKVANTGGTAGTGTGLLFLVDADSGVDVRGKAAIVMERTTTFNRGRLHILMNDVADASNPTLSNYLMTFTHDGLIGLANNNPSSWFHLRAGGATVGNAPLKFTSGSVLATPEAGAMEFDGSHFYGTVGSTRYQLDQQTAIGTAGGDLGGSYPNPTVNNLHLSGDTSIGHKLTSVTDPTNPQDAATKNYVDNIAQGLSPKPSARVATTGSETFTISSGNVTQISGTTVDGVSPAVNDRVLVKDAPAATGAGSANSTQPGNGIYYVTSNTTNLSLSRVTDMDDVNDPPEGAFVFVEAGTINASSGFVVTTPSSNAAFTYGSGNIAWTQFSGAGEITAGNGLNKSGNTLSINTAITADLSSSQAFTNKDLSGAGNTFPTFNQNTTGSAAKWTTARNLAGNSVDGSANVAFANKFIVQGTTDSGLSGAQFLGALGTGILKNTTTTGVLSIATAGDFPTLNQDTTGTATKATNLKGGNSTTLLGSVPYQSDVDTTTLLSPNTTSTKKFLRQTGTGSNGSAPAWDTIAASDVPTLNQNTTGSAATLTTARAIYGNNFDGSAALTQIIASTYGGTGNSFTKFSGPAASEKTFTLPNASANILTDNALVTVAQGGTGVSTSTGTGNNVLSDSPTFTTQAIIPLLIGSTASAGTLTLQSTSHATKGKILLGTSAYDEVNNRLGIAVAAPAQALDVLGQVKVTGTGTFGRLDFATSGATTHWFIQADDAMGGGGIHGLGFYDANNSAFRMAILNAGQVGINVTNPTAQLEVNGYMRTTSTASAPTGGTGLEFTYSSGGLIQAYNRTGLAYTALQIEGLTTYINASSGGNVGIGTTSPTNLLSLNGQSARTIWMERNTTSNTAGNNLTVQASGAHTGSTDKAGGDLILAPGFSTGQGGANARIQTMTRALSTGTGDNTATDRIIATSPKSVTNNSATTLFSMTLANGSVVAGLLRYVVEVTDGTDYQVEEGVIAYHVTNKASTIANNAVTKSGNQQVTTSGTLSVTFTITAANPALIQVNANSSLTPSTGYPRITCVLENLTQQAVSVS